MLNDVMSACDYKPVLRDDGTNPHVISHGKKLLMACVLFMILWFVLMCALAGWSAGDPLSQARYLVGCLTRVIIGDVGIGFALWFLDYLTNGNLLGRILQNGIACALLAGAIIWANYHLFLGL